MALGEAGNTPVNAEIPSKLVSVTDLAELRLVDVYRCWCVLFMMSFLRIPGLLGTHIQRVSCKFGYIQTDGVESESKLGGDRLNRQTYVRNRCNQDRCPVGRAAQSNARFLAMSSRVCNTTLPSELATALQRMKDRFQSEVATLQKFADGAKVFK